MTKQNYDRTEWSSRTYGREAKTGQGVQVASMLLGNLFHKSVLITVTLLCWTEDIWTGGTTRQPVADQRNLRPETEEAKTINTLRINYHNGATEVIRLRFHAFHTCVTWTSLLVIGFVWLCAICAVCCGSNLRCPRDKSAFAFDS